MRRVFRTAAFKRDYRRVLRSSHDAHVGDALLHVIELLAADLPLPASYADHPLKGPWQDHRECHVRPDLLLIYRKSAQPESGRSRSRKKGSRVATLQLIRLGSHARLFG